MIDYSNLEDAFSYVSSDQPFMNHAIINKNTGETFYQSDMSGIDEFPEDYDDEKYIDVPHKNDLDLGRKLVYDFVSIYFPEKFEEVEYIFRKKGAYSRYKYFLESIGFLDKWYEFENQRTKKALIDWSQDNNLDLTGEEF